MQQYVGILGLIAVLALCYLLSTDRRKISWRLVIWGILLQLVLAVVILKTTPGRVFFDWMNDCFGAVMEFSQAGSRFVFGNLADANIPVGTRNADGSLDTSVGYWARPAANFAFSVLPTVVFFSALMAVMYHLGIMHRLVWVMAWIMKRTLGTSGAESMSSAANVFAGQTEAPLVIKPFLEKMTQSELLAVMVGGMANIAGGVLAAYVAMLSGQFPEIAGHLMAASLMSAPASLVLAKMLVPETGPTETGGEMKLEHEKIDVNVFDAATRGASEGLQLALNVGAMLIAFLALVAMSNHLWGMGCHGITALTGWDLSAIDTLQEVLGYFFYPFAWLMGIPPEDCMVAGKLLGEKTILNEFVAYAHMGDFLNGMPLMDGTPAYPLAERTKVILAYALCGFANIGSIGILVGGMGALVPSRRKDIARLGLKALIGGTLSTFMTAAIAGLLL